MNRRLLVRPAAVSDLRNAHDWCEGKQARLGQQFVEAVELKLTQIGENPYQFPVVRGTTRRAIIKRFPFGIFFVADSSSTVVLAIMHHARAPLRWQRRL